MPKIKLIKRSGHGRTIPDLRMRNQFFSFFLPVPEVEVVMEVVVTVTTPGTEELCAKPGEPGMMMDVLVAPL